MLANDRLEPKLNDPALQQHPKRPEYVAAFETRAFQIRVLRQRADPFLREFALIWQRLTPETQARVRSEPGFPTTTTPAVLAHRVFAWYASDGYWGGVAEAPFEWLVLCGAIGALRACLCALGAILG
jgi:hypothetical protein